MRMLTAVAALLLIPGIVSASPVLQEGEWEFDIWYNFIGVPQHFPSYSNRQCISRESPMPEITRVGHECQQQLQGEFGRTYTWMVDCSNEWEMVNGMGRIHYWGERARGDVHIQVLNPFNPPQPMIFHIQGKRIGECQEARRE